MTIECILASKLSKEETLQLITKQSTYFNKLINIALSNHLLNWRAIWMLHHTINQHNNNLNVIIENYDKLLEFSKKNIDGYQREFIKLSNLILLSDSQEILFFDYCLTIWKNIQKSSGLRFIAFKTLLKITKKYPELRTEIIHYTNEYFTTSLSKGIQQIVTQQINTFHLKNSTYN